MKKLIVLALTTLLVVSLCAVFANAEETNVAKGATYTATGVYTDPTTKAVQYADKGGVLTDGKAAAAAGDLGYSAAGWVGLNVNGEAVKDGKCEIIVDLGKSVSGLTKFTLNTQTCSGGISCPKEVEVQVSADKTTFKSVGKVKTGTRIYDGSASADPTDAKAKEFGIYEYTVSSAENTARYVKYVVTFGTNWFFVSEVGAYTGAPAGSTPTEANSETVSGSSSAPATSNSSVSSASSAPKTSSSASSAAKVSSSAAASSESDNNGLSTGAIVGIVAGAVVIIGVVVFFVVKKKK